MYKFPRTNTRIPIVELPARVVERVGPSYSKEQLSGYIDVIKEQIFLYEDDQKTGLNPKKYTRDTLKELASKLDVPITGRGYRKPDVLKVLFRRIVDMEELWAEIGEV